MQWASMHLTLIARKGRKKSTAMQSLFFEHQRWVSEQR